VLLVAVHEEPEGSFTAQENAYGIEGFMALFTNTTMVTPEELDSRIRPGVGVKL
jgi:hypothetical protein